LTRVVVADDSVLLRAGLVRLLADEGFTVVGQASDAETLLDVAAQTTPDVAIVDIRMPPTHTTEGLQAALELRRRERGFPVLLLSQYIETRDTLELLTSGARGIGYLLKDRVGAIDDFVETLRHVAAGGSAIDPQIVARLVRSRQQRHDGLNVLSPRERDVLALMAEGKSNSGIARRLHLTDRTVEAHVRSMFTKLNLPPEPDDHRRVLAVIAYLRNAAD
jgi:DNA-binding NarL/FixJ family response regulator